MSAITIPTNVEQRILRDGYQYIPVCSVIDQNNVAASCCSWCEARGQLEARPYHKGKRIRIVTRCHRCDYVEEV